MTNEEKKCLSYHLEQLNPENAIENLLFAEKNSIPDFADKVADYILENFEIVQKKRMCALSHEKTLKFLRSEKLKASEMTKLETALMWLNQDVANRKQFALSLFSSVRLSLLTREQMLRLSADEHTLSKWPLLARLVFTNLRERLAGDRQTHTTTRRSTVAVIGGHDGAKRLASVILYDFKYRRWTNAKTHPISCIHDLPKPRSFFGCVRLSDRIYVVGGWIENEGRTDSTLIFDIRQPGWMEGPKLKHKRGQFALITLGCCIVALGGWNGDALNSCEILDVGSDHWKHFPSMTVARNGLCAVELNGAIYAIGGQKESSVEVLDPSREQWRAIAPLSCHRYGASAAVIEGKIYVVGGWKLNSVEMYSPETRQWQLVASMLQPRFYTTSVPMDNKMLVFGGWHQKELVCAEEYNPRTNKWSRLATDMPYGVKSAAAIFLPTI